MAKHFKKGENEFSAPFFSSRYFEEREGWKFVRERPFPSLIYLMAEILNFMIQKTEAENVIPFS